MSTRLLGFALAGAVVLAASSAHAVDVRNDDNETYEILVSVFKGDTGMETNDTLFSLAPGQTLSGVCATCIVSLGQDEDAESVAAEQAQLVTVKDGKLSVN